MTARPIRNATLAARAHARQTELEEIRRRAREMLARMLTPAQFEARAPSPAARAAYQAMREQLLRTIEDPAHSAPVRFSNQRRTPR